MKLKLRLSHSADELSSPDPQGCRHQVSLDPGRTKQGRRHITYEARLRSNCGLSDPRHQEVVIAKFPARGLGTQEWAQKILKDSQLARDLSVKVNHMFHHMVRPVKPLPPSFIMSCSDTPTHPSNVISFLPTQANRLDSVAKRDKTRQKGEYFVFEDKLDSVQTFMDASGVVQSAEDVHQSYLHAAVHHAFLHSHGQRVICNLVGLYREKEERYTLTTPTFHSSDESHGSEDKGVLGMAQVIQNHKCSSLCRHLPNMRDVLRQHLLARKNTRSNV